MNDIYRLDLHEELTIKEGVWIMRVAGGWLYFTLNRPAVFVPYDNEFMEVMETK